MGSRPRPDDQMKALFADGWPAFISADEEVKRHYGRVRELFRQFELALLDEQQVIVAAGWAVPLRWDGSIQDLPSGYSNGLARSLQCHDNAEQADTLSIMAAQIRPDLRGRGLAGELLKALRQVGEQAGLEQVICPVRPTLKARYPLTPIERFMSWTRPDGSPLDPWIRTHTKLGATILAAAPHSQTMTGTVAQWQEWTGMVFPGSGEYVIPDGLSTLHIDLDHDLGAYTEPNVWMRHR
jgi:GNAT superfamily N-acetyltransferase